jgi:hypothetical protein
LVVAALTDANDPFMALLSLMAMVLGLVVVITYVIRIMLLSLLIAAAPIAGVPHPPPPRWPGTAVVEEPRRCAGGPGRPSLVLITALKVFFSSDQTALFGVRSSKSMLDLLLVICLLYVLMRIPSWISKMVWRGGLSSSPIVRAAKTIVTIVIFRGMLGKAGAARTSPATPASGPSAAGGRHTGPGPSGVGQGPVARSWRCGAGRRRAS